MADCEGVVLRQVEVCEHRYLLWRGSWVAQSMDIEIIDVAVLKTQRFNRREVEEMQLLQF